MAKLRNFTIQAAAEARWESNRVLIRRNQLPASSDTLRSIRYRYLDDEYPLCKTRRAASPVVPAVSADTMPSTIASPVRSSAGPAASYVSPTPLATFSPVQWMVTSGAGIYGASSIHRQGFCAVPVSSLSWSPHSLIPRLWSHTLPRFVLIWTLFLPRGPYRMTVSIRLLRGTK